MDWSGWASVGKAILSFAPTVGGALLGPPGAVAGTAVKAIAKALGEDEKTITPKKVLTRLQEQPEETARAITQADLEYERELTKRLDIVNRTMRVEAKSEHWPQYSWRPWNGFWFPPTVIGIYIILPILDKPVPTVPQWVWIGWLAILGVAVWDRGKAQRAMAGDQSMGVLSGVIKAIRG
ncbi:MAG: hypothetical protein JRJ79_16680 [Deltaproteobacteria bacterium]|nr:hypothetical protein [Deltaproteobacteria bacterium]